MIEPAYMELAVLKFEQAAAMGTVMAAILQMHLLSYSGATALQKNPSQPRGPVSVPEYP